MIRYEDPDQQRLPGFEKFFGIPLDMQNRWIKLSEIIPWDEFAEAYNSNMSSGMGRPAKPARLVIGSSVSSSLIFVRQSGEKPVKKVEFGAKLGVALTSDGLAQVDNLDWNSYHEGHDLPIQVENYKKRNGCYTEAVLADQIYGSRENRRYLKERDIRFAGKALVRPKKETVENQHQLREEKRRRKSGF